MICPVCQKEIADGTLICPICHSRASELVQEKKFSEIRAKAASSLMEIFKSPIFVALMVSLGVFAAAGCLITLFSLQDGIFGVIGNGVFYLIPAIYAGISAYGAWRLYRSNESLDPADARKLENHPRVMGGYQLAYTIIVGICSALLLLAAVMLFGAISSVENADALFNETLIYIGEFEAGDAAMMMGAFEWLISVGGIIILAILIVVVAVVMTAMIFSVITYKKTKKYYEMLTRTVMGSKFDTELKFPKACLYIFGVLDILSGFATIFTSVISALFAFGSGAYLIVTALLLTKIKKEQTGFAEEIDREDAILAEIRVKTNDEIRRTASEAAPDPTVTETPEETV